MQPRWELENKLLGYLQRFNALEFREMLFWVRHEETTILKTVPLLIANFGVIVSPSSNVGHSWMPSWPPCRPTGALEHNTISTVRQAELLCACPLR